MSRAVIHAGGLVFPGLCLDGLAGRARGWLFRSPADGLQAVVLTPCRGVHFWGLAHAVDVFFLGAGGEVVGRRLGRPGSPPAMHPAARAVVEIAAAYVPPGFHAERFTWRT
jgi:hypothetical protein